MLKWKGYKHAMLKHCELPESNTETAQQVNAETDICKNANTLVTCVCSVTNCFNTTEVFILLLFLLLL